MKRTTALKVLQLAVSVSVLLLLWLIYSGIVFAGTGLVGVAYVIAAVAAARDRLVGIWLAFLFSLLAFSSSGWGVYRYFDNGFNWLAGNFPGRVGIYWPAYIFLFVALGSLAVIVLHLLSWRWMLRPRQPRYPAR